MPASLPEGVSHLDVAIIALVLLSGCVGLWRGLIREVLSLASLVIAIVVVRLYSQVGAAQLAGFIDNEMVRFAVVSALLFITVMVLGTWLIALLQKIVTFTGLRIIDRLAGAGFGVARGALIVLVIVHFVGPFAANNSFWNTSLGVRKAQEALTWGAAYLQPVTPTQITAPAARRII